MGGVQTIFITVKVPDLILAHSSGPGNTPVVLRRTLTYTLFVPSRLADAYKIACFGLQESGGR